MVKEAAHQNEAEHMDGNEAGNNAADEDKAPIISNDKEDPSKSAGVNDNDSDKESSESNKSSKSTGVDGKSAGVDADPN
jgi:hypothetical protein